MNKIETYSAQINSKLYSLLNMDILQNPYLYIDVNTYGFQGSNIQTYFATCAEKISVIIYQYYNSIQLLVNQKELPNEQTIKEIANFIATRKVIMVSGVTSLITKLKTYLPNYKQTNGHLFEYQGKIEQKLINFPKFQWAHSEQDFERLAIFITSDSSIGSHYNIAQLKQQLLERHQKYGCQNVFLEEDKKIIAHVGTYACYKDLAVIGGLLVDPSQRGKGLARKIMTFISCQCVKTFKQKPVFYCYIPDLFKFYKTCDYKEIYDCSKLELIGDKNA
ncbi:MAG: GNAT family N-acetyltransferase [Elusimicrobiaceae bacterium]|nr:GNAT family N-acetyltransferase [Elusimicrobiaceae bacterium]